MHASRQKSRRWVGVALGAILLLGAIGLAGVVWPLVQPAAPGTLQTADAPTALPEAPVEATEEVIVLTPPPEGEVIHLPTTLPGQIVVVGYPTPTPWPTFTPVPTPTPYLGPTMTPLPPPQPAFDAAGKLLYVVRTQLSQGQSQYQVDGAVWSISVDREAIPIDSPKESMPPGWRANGWLQTYTSWDRTKVAVVVTTMGGDRIFILDPSTGQRQEVKESMNAYGVFAGWHPDNQRIVYLAGDRIDGGLWLLNISTGERTVIVQQDPLNIMDAAIAPEGQRIVYSQRNDLNSPQGLRLTDVYGTAPKLLADNIPFGLSWSPDGNYLVFHSTQGLCVMDLEKGQCKLTIEQARSGYGNRPAWSPDSRYLAYLAPDLQGEAVSTVEDKSGVLAQQDPERAALQGLTIWLLEMESGASQKLVPLEFTGEPSANIDPIFSPDGSMIAYASFVGSQASLSVFDLKGQNLRLIDEAPGLIRFPVWTK